MDEDAFDLAGFCVGVVDEASLLGPHRVAEGDVVIGLASTGLHANGYSLVRSALLPAFELDATPPGLDRPLADELLEPCAIYAPDVVALARDGLLHAAAHVTGGGILENLPRALPEGLGATIQSGELAGAPDLRPRARDLGRLRRRPVRDVQHGDRHAAGRRTDLGPMKCWPAPRIEPSGSAR